MLRHSKALWINVVLNFIQPYLSQQISCPDTFDKLVFALWVVKLTFCTKAPGTKLMLTCIWSWMTHLWLHYGATKDQIIPLYLSCDLSGLNYSIHPFLLLPL